jgi:hypothetical protein
MVESKEEVLVKEERWPKAISVAIPLHLSPPPPFVNTQRTLFIVGFRSI